MTVFIRVDCRVPVTDKLEKAAHFNVRPTTAATGISPLFFKPLPSDQPEKQIVIFNVQGAEFIESFVWIVITGSALNQIEYRFVYNCDSHFCFRIVFINVEDIDVECNFFARPIYFPVNLWGYDELFYRIFDRHGQVTDPAGGLSKVYVIFSNGFVDPW